MTTDYVDLMAYHIRLIWDNDEYAHLYVQELVRDADSISVLSDALNDFYHESIDFVLRETPSQSIGHMLVAELCLNPGTSVFDEIARVYWQDKSNDMEVL